MERLDLRLSRATAERSYLYEILGDEFKELIDEEGLSYFSTLRDKLLTVSYYLAGDFDPKWGINIEKPTISLN